VQKILPERFHRRDLDVAKGALDLGKVHASGAGKEGFP
jgi:hypothetical protein